MIGSVAASVLVIGLCLSFGLQSPQAVNSEARTLSETLEQSLKPLPRIGELSPATAVPSQSPTTTPQTGNTEPHFTSIQEGLLIAVMNAQIPDNPIPPDRFQLSTVKGDATPDRVALYENIDHGMYLMLTGSPDDLVMVSLLIPLDRFVGEVDGKATGVGAEAFSRCVLRLGTVADRSWAPQLYTWMNENMARALVVPEGVTLSHKRLMAKFSTFEMPHTKLMVSMTIGIAAETTSP